MKKEAYGSKRNTGSRMLERNGEEIMRTLSYSLVVAVLVIGCGPASKIEATDSSRGDEPERESMTVAWLTDFGAAKKEAAAKKLPILLDFAGSDWCGWCIKLDNEVFNKREFKKYAKDNLVLVLADFPSRKKQPDAIKRQNKALADTYGVRGFPTVLLLDANAKVLARTGYREGGAEKYVAHLKKALGDKSAASAPF